MPLSQASSFFSSGRTRPPRASPARNLVIRDKDRNGSTMRIRCLNLVIWRSRDGPSGNDHPHRRQPAGDAGASRHPPIHQSGGSSQ